MRGSNFPMSYIADKGIGCRPCVVLACLALTRLLLTRLALACVALACLALTRLPLTRLALACLVLTRVTRGDVEVQCAEPLHRVIAGE